MFYSLKKLKYNKKLNFIKILYWRYKDFSIQLFFKIKFDNLQINFKLLFKYRFKYFNLKFYSQQNEDKYIYNFFDLDKTKKGTYLEIGACDGKLFSNTLTLNEVNRFNGILIEPQTNYFKELIKNRPNDTLFNCVVTDSASEKTLFIGENLEAGVLNNISTDLNRFPEWEKYKLENRMLKDLINSTEFNYLDIVSIDTEGSELEVIKSIDFQIPIILMIIEAHQKDIERDSELKQILTSNGFKLVKKIRGNYWFFNTKNNEMLNRLFLRKSFKSLLNNT